MDLHGVGSGDAVYTFVDSRGVARFGHDKGFVP
jgi:hypothetical protein